MIGANINAYFEAAMRYPVDRLVAVMRGQDKSIPQAAAMMALQIKEPMVDAARGQEAAQRPQEPSVKERMTQEVSMLPENAGIMNLPVQQEFADGGIVAFNAGGLTPAEQAELDRRRREELRSYLPDFGRIKERVGNWWENVQQIPFESKTPLIRYGKQERPGIFPYEQPKETLERLREEQPPPSTNVYPDEQFRGMRVNPPAPAPDTTTPPFVDARTSSAGKGAGKGTGKGAGKAAAKEEPSGIAALPTFTPGEKGNLATELENIRKVMPDIGKDYDTLKGDVKKTYADLQAERERTKPQGKAMEGLEKLLAKEEGEAKGKESRNLNMALINAGLAIAGGTSQYAIQNIAEGAQVGTKQYQAGLEKLEEAAKERRRQAAAIEEARRAEARGDWKEAFQLKKEAADAEFGIQKSKIEGVAKITGESVKVAQDIVNNQNQIYARDRQVQFQVGAELEKQRMGDIAAEKRARIQADAYRSVAGAKLDPFNVAWDNATKAMQIEMQDPMLKAELMKDRAKYERMFNAYLQKALSGQMGSAAAPPPSGGKLIGFEPQ
jgi:hypothetical protein